LTFSKHKKSPTDPRGSFGLLSHAKPTSLVVRRNYAQGTSPSTQN
jgi:hypothetical protein